MMGEGTLWTLRVEELTVRRGRSVLVREFTWEHSAGRVVWVVGENGRGKSSLLRALAGRLRASGRMRYSGPAGERLRIVYYHPDMRLPRGVRVGSWLRLVERLVCGGQGCREPGLAPVVLWSGRQVGRLSTGEQKRLVLDALLRQPAPVVLLDEPYEHLSGEARARLTRLLEERGRGGLVIVSTNQDLPAQAREGVVLRLDGDRVCVTAGGDLVG